MNKPNNSKFVPSLPDDNNINEFIPTVPDSKDNSIKIYDGVAEFMMNDSDNLKSVKLRAKALAIQKVQKKIADYVYGFLKDRLLTFPDDEVLSIANEISNITDVKYNVLDSDDDKILIRATVTAQIDDNDIMNYVIECFKERDELKSQIESLRKENEDIRRQRDKVSSEKSALESKNRELQRQIDELKRQITPQVVSKDKIALANQKLYEAYRFLLSGNYNEAIKLCDEAIELNPNYAEAYNNRGNAYLALRQSSKAQADFAKARKLGW